MLLTSTRARPGSPVDALSDYDVVLVVEDVRPFFKDRSWLEDFGDAPYVAKCLWRDELLPAKWCLDYDMKHVYLRRMLEWRMEIDHGWSEPTDRLGKGLEKRLPPEIWRELEATYTGADIADNWEALFRTVALFRRVATDVGDDLGYAYPQDLDQRVTGYVRTIKGYVRTIKDLDRGPSERPS